MPRRHIIPGKIKAATALRLADRLAILKRFIADAAHLRPAHVDLFDEILIDLVPHAELIARADLAERLSLISNAPRVLVGRLARESDQAIGALLRDLKQRGMFEDTLVIVAGAKASLAPELSAMVHNDPKVDQHEILVKKGSGDIERNGETVRLASWEKVSFQDNSKKMDRATEIGPPTPISAMGPNSGPIAASWG